MKGFLLSFLTLIILLSLITNLEMYFNFPFWLGTIILIIFALLLGKMGVMIDSK